MTRPLALLLALALLLLSGCQQTPDLSVLPELELQTDGAGEYILLDGVRYNALPFEIVGNWNPGRWLFAGETETRAARLRGDTLFTVRGDEETRFLWSVRENRPFGGNNFFLFLREGYSLTLPDSGTAFDRGTLNTYRKGGLFGKKPMVTCEFTDPEMLTAIFDAWDHGEEAALSEDWQEYESRSLELWSAQYPWLAFHLSCYRYDGGETIYFRNREDQRVAIPAETAAALTWEEPGFWQRLLG